VAGVRGNQADFRIGKQSAKGTPVTAFTDDLFFTGGSLEPTREIDQLSETDSNRHEGEDFVQQTAASGSPECYVRDASIHHILQSAMGTLVTSGSTNFTHTLSLANTIPYYTFGRSLGGILFQEFDDCKVNELTISADTASPLTATIDFMGRSATRLVADGPGAIPAASTVAPFTFNEATVTLGGVATSLISSFEVTITNSVSLQQTDDAIPYDVVEGKREITFAYDMIFEDMVEYNKFHTGTGAGTTQSNSVYTTSLDFLFSHGVNNSLDVSSTKVAYEEFPVEPDAGGDPITVAVRARHQRSGTFAAIVKNQQAT
jgi:hypothetical protein